MISQREEMVRCGRAAAKGREETILTADQTIHQYDFISWLVRNEGTVVVFPPVAVSFSVSNLISPPSPSIKYRRNQDLLRNKGRWKKIIKQADRENINSS